MEEKSRIGDWEGDTIIGAKHQGAIVSYVDRHSKFTLLKKIERKEAALVVAATLEKMKDLPHKVETITFDNGKEFARHQEISIALTACCYFAQPYHSYMIFFGSLEAQLVGFSENGHPKFVGGGSLPAGLKTKIGYQSTK